MQYIQSHVENHQIADLHVKGHLEVLLEENQSINPMVKKDLSSYFSDQILKTSAQRKRNYRSKEPSKITKERKEKAREYIKEKRSAESSLEKKERQQKDAAKTANRRKQESSLEKKERQQKNTAKTANRRKQESSLEKKERQQKDAAKTANSRKQESSLEKKERQQKNTAKTANRRKQESSLEKKERQKKDLENKVKTRSCERDIGAQEPTFSPLITEEQTKSCLAKFIQATSNESLNVVECAVCAELSKDTEKFDITSLPGRELISQEESDGNILSEYQHGDLILSSGGITDDESVNCCKTCLRHLRNGKLPPLSVANNFQIGCTPLL